jgi:hypothetical protein
MFYYSGRWCKVYRIGFALLDVPVIGDINHYISGRQHVTSEKEPVSPLSSGDASGRVLLEWGRRRKRKVTRTMFRNLAHVRAYLPMVSYLEGITGIWPGILRGKNRTDQQIPRG